MDDHLQIQRFERKYFVTEAQAAQIRQFVSAYLAPDPFTAGQANRAYPVHSLYLDSAELLTYWATVHCEKRRFKLRVRYYDEKPESPVFFEIKRRENECVLKQRGTVQRAVAPELLAGRLPGPEHLVSDSTRHLAAVQKFCYLTQRLNAHPVVHVAYEREAWVSPTGNSVRVTIDRDVRGEEQSEPDFRTRFRQPVFPFGDKRVLELKFTNRFPDWFRALVQHFNLLQTGAPKYCGSVGYSGAERRVAFGANGPQQKLAELVAFC